MVWWNCTWVGSAQSCSKGTEATEAVRQPTGLGPDTERSKGGPAQRRSLAAGGGAGRLLSLLVLLPSRGLQALGQMLAGCAASASGQVLLAPDRLTGSGSIVEAQLLP